MEDQGHKPSIAYLTSLYGRAGDTFIRREVEELRRLGWTVHTFSIRRADPSEGVSEDIIREQRATTYVLEQGWAALLLALLRLTVRYPGRMFKAVTQVLRIRWPGLKSVVWHFIYLLEASYLAEQLLQRDVALLHNHIAMNSATVAMLAATLSDIPYSMTVHGPHEFFAPEHWALGAKIAASALTVCISDFGKSQCMLFSPPEAWEKLHVIHCGLEERFLADVPKPLPQRPSLLCVGRIAAEKGQLVLVDAVAKLRAEGEDVDVVIVGDGPLRDDVSARIQDLDLGDRIRLVGWQGSEKVRAWMENSRLLVLPSFAEGIPVVLMEAMALGRPVIATSVGGIPELVNGENGWLVTPGSVSALVKGIREALRHPLPMLTEMGMNARRQVLERHSINAEVRKLSALFLTAATTSRSMGKVPQLLNGNTFVKSER